MVKKISIVITVVLAVSLIFAICYSQHEAQANAEYYEKLDKSALPLKVQKDELERELSVLEKEYSEQMKGAATEELLVTDLDKSLYSDLFPMTQEADVAGILVLSDDEFFGNTGKITGKQFDELRKAGWSYCLGWNGEGKFEDWMKKMSALLKKSGLSIPNAVYFAEGSYSAELDNILLQYGITIAVHHGEESQELIVTDAGEGVWRPGAKIWNYSGVRTDIDNLVGKGGNLAFTVSFEQTSNDVWKESGFQSMLDYINKYIREGKLIVTDFETARSCHMETAEEAEGLSQELKERKETLEKEIEELEKQIDEIYQ